MTESVADKWVEKWCNNGEEASKRKAWLWRNTLLKVYIPSPHMNASLNRPGQTCVPRICNWVSVCMSISGVCVHMCSVIDGDEAVMHQQKSHLPFIRVCVWDSQSTWIIPKCSGFAFSEQLFNLLLSTLPQAANSISWGVFYNHVLNISRQIDMHQA